MKLRVLILIFIASGLLPGCNLFAQGYSSGAFHYYQLYAQTSPSSEFLSFINKLEEKREDNSEKEFLKVLFTRTHRKFLKTYQGNASFSQLSKTGIYNCLTGTALYALLLQEFGYEFKIIETNYHIFLVVNTAEGDVLFEATDPHKGYVTDHQEIEKRIQRYKENRAHTAEAGKNYYHYSFKLYNEVTLDEMSGLLYYNQAVEAFNKGQLVQAITYLDQANRSYHSPRIEELSRIILLIVVQSRLDYNTKETFVRKIQSIRKDKLPGITSTMAN